MILRSSEVIKDKTSSKMDSGMDNNSSRNYELKRCYVSIKCEFLSQNITPLHLLSTNPLKVCDSSLPSTEEI